MIRRARAFPAICRYGKVEQMMFRVLMAALLAAGIFAFTPSVKTFAQEKAVTAKDKKATCEFGADDQKLKGAERKNFMSKCMARGEGDVKAKPKHKPKKKEEKKEN
jgi:hypothetical protein